MVQDLQDLLGLFGPQAVVDAGDRIDRHQGEAVDAGRHNGPGIPVDGRKDDAQHHHHNRQSPADHMGDKVEDLLPPGIVGQLPVRQLGSLACHDSALPPDEEQGQGTGAGMGTDDRAHIGDQLDVGVVTLRDHLL